MQYPGLDHQPDEGVRRGALFLTARKLLRSQFGQPSGILGALAGRVMARSTSNLERIRWTISLLEIGRYDRVFEIGFGPGVATALVSAIATDGFVAGIDHSKVMVRQANRRNAAAVRAGKVVLQLGSVTQLPDFEAFDKIFTINSIHFWPEPIECLIRLHLLLRPGGRIAVTFQPRSRDASDLTAKLIGEELVNNLERSGFSNCRLEMLNIRPVAVACAIGTR